MEQKHRKGKKGISVRLISSLDKVFADREPEEGMPSRPLSILYGETVSFQIAYCLEEDSGCCGLFPKARVVKLEGKDEVPVTGMQLSVQIRQVLPVYCQRPCNPDSSDDDYLFKEPGWAPDLLRELNGETGAAAEPGIWHSLWVDVSPAEKTPGGIYKISVELSGEEEVFAEVRIRVIERTLPRLDIPHTEWFHFDGIADYYRVPVFSEAFWNILEKFLCHYVKRGANTILTPLLTPPLDTEEGMERTTVQLVDVAVTDNGYEFDFSNLERFMKLAAACGIEYYEIGHLFTQWGAAAAPKVMAVQGGVKRRIFGWETPFDAPEYLKFLSVLLPAVKRLLKERGLLERTFFHISDEPDQSSIHYRMAQQTVRSMLKGCTIIEAVSDYGYYEKGLVDIPVCAENHIGPFLEKRPKRLWTYYCCAQTVDVPNRFISMPSYRNRIYGTLLYWHRIDGFLHWGFNFYNGERSRVRINPYETPDGAGSFPSGDPFLVYPGEGGRPEDSIRIMVQEEAIADYRALKLLEEQIGRGCVMELIRREAGMELTFCRYPREEAFLLRLRERVNLLLDSGTLKKQGSCK